MVLQQDPNKRFSVLKGQTEHLKIMMISKRKSGRVISVTKILVIIIINNRFCFYFCPIPMLTVHLYEVETRKHQT